jgi:hypothetical protein
MILQAIPAEYKIKKLNHLLKLWRVSAGLYLQGSHESMWMDFSAHKIKDKVRK